MGDKCVSQRLQFAFGLGAFLLLSGCTSGKDFPRLVDIPDAPAQASPMEEKRKIAQEMVDQLSEDQIDGSEGEAEDASETAENGAISP